MIIFTSVELNRWIARFNENDVKTANALSNHFSIKHLELLAALLLKMNSVSSNRRTIKKVQTLTCVRRRLEHNSRQQLIDPNKITNKASIVCPIILGIKRTNWYDNFDWQSCVIECKNDGWYDWKGDEEIKGMKQKKNFDYFDYIFSIFSSLLGRCIEWQQKRRRTMEEMSESPWLHCSQDDITPVAKSFVHFWFVQVHQETITKHFILFCDSLSFSFSHQLFFLFRNDVRTDNED